MPLPHIDQADLEAKLRELIPESVLQFDHSRSSGPGGQNVNKVNTRVELRFDIEACDMLLDWQKSRIRRRLRNRISKAGVLRIVGTTTRSQVDNRQEALNRFYQLLASALYTPLPRRPTKTPARTKRRRLNEKKRRSETKQLRQDVRRESY